MPTLTLTLPKPHAGQLQAIREAGRINVVNCGRRFGKTELGKNRLVVPKMLAYPQAWFSPTYKMLIEVWRDMSLILAPITARVSAAERRLELVTGGVIEFWSLDNPDVARGRKYANAIIDEAAMVPKLMDIWQYAIRPTLADMVGEAWIMSTPRGRNGFWQMYQWGQDPAYPEWASWSMPTAANPFIPPSEIEAMRQSLPERVFAQEILAQFLEDAGGVFRGVMAAATATEQTEAKQGHEYIIGVDWGKMSDFTAFAVLDMTTNEIVYLDRFNQIDYHVQIGRLVQLCRLFRPSLVIAERNSIGDPIIEQLQREGLPVQAFNTSNASKANAIDALSMAFERGDIRIIPDQILVSELQAYEMERLPSGMLRYSAPHGMHDDTVMALAIAWYSQHMRVETYTSIGEIANISRW